MKPVVFEHEAEIEFYNSVAFYEERIPGLGAKFDSELQLAVSDIQKDPSWFGLIQGDQGIRKLVMQGFPFVLYFVDRPEEIWIVAVAHCSRKPGYWSDRPS